MNQPSGLRLVYTVGVAQGLALVTFPAASAIFTSPTGYRFSATRYGFMFLPQVLLAIVASGGAPKLARRFGLKRVLVLGLSGDVVAMLLLAASRMIQGHGAMAYGVLLIATGALGFGFGATVMALNTFAEELSPGREDRAVLTLNALLGTGTALAPALAALFVGLGAWWMLPVCVGCASLVLLVLTQREPLQIREDTGGAASGLVAAMTQRLPAGFWLFAAAVFVYGILETLNGNWASLYLVLQRGVSVQAASWALTAFWAMVTVGRLLFAAISAKVSVRTIYVALPFVLALALILVSQARGDLGGWFAFGTAGLACSAFFPLSISFAGDEFPGMASVMSGELIAFYQVGYGVAAFGSGPLRDAGGFSFAMIFAWASVLAVGLGILAAMIIRNVPVRASS